MTLTILKPQSGAPSNKPPKDPPDQSLWTDAINFTDGQTVWRTNIRPDRIAFVTYLQNHQFAVPKSSKGKLGEIFLGMLEGLSGAAEFEEGGAGPWVNEFKTKGKFSIPCGPRGARVYIELNRKKPKDSLEPVHWMKVEFNPRKVQPQGIAEFLFILEQSAQFPINVPAFLADARITRYDAAIDFIGVSPADLLATTVRPGKRLEYHGNDGVLETTQLHRKRAVAKKPIQVLKAPLGPLAVKIYDRNRERAAHGKPPPVPGFTVSRAEVVRTRLKPGFSFGDLMTEEPFKGIRISYAPTAALPINVTLWRRYFAVRNALGHDQAAAVLSLNKKEAKGYAKAFEAHPGDLVDSLSQTLWLDGIAETGLGDLISKAKSATPLT